MGRDGVLGMEGEPNSEIDAIIHNETKIVQGFKTP